MKTVKVEYTVHNEYAEQNEVIIRKVMSELKGLNNNGIQYSTFIKKDGIGFVLIGIYPNQETLDIVTQLPTFQKFRSELIAKEPVAMPKTEELHLVASAYDFFE